MKTDFNDINRSLAATLVIRVPERFSINCNDKALMKFCRTDTGYNSGNDIVNRNTIFKITISLQKIGMCFPKSSISSQPYAPKITAQIVNR